MLTDPSGHRVDLSPSGWRLLAAVAAAETEGVARSALAQIVSPAAKLSSLRKHLFDLRRALEGSGLILLDGDGDTLRLSEDVYCDLRDLRAERPRRAPHEIYRGTFFDVTTTFRHDPWTAWLAERRRDLLDLYIRKAGECLDSVDGSRKVRAQEARHLLKHAPGHADATTYLMLEAARACDAEAVQQQFGALQAFRSTTGAQADRRTTGVFHRLVGVSQRALGPAAPPEEMDLPTIYVSTPPIGGASKAERMLRSLLVDVTIGLCRASLFRVIASDRADLGPASAGEPGSPRSYRVSTSIVDHVLGPQVVFTLLSPKWQVLWTEKVEAAVDLTVSAYNVLTAGVLRSLVERIKDVEIEAFRLDVDPGAYALYLAGYSSLGSLDLAQLRRGRHHLRRALSQSPDFAPTPSALARSLQLEWLVTGRGGSDLLTDARGHALRAIEADPHEARGFKALAFCDLFESKNYDIALENYARAEQLNRNYADLVAEHANCLLHSGLAEEALVKIDFAMRLNPEFGDMYRWTKASACFFLSRYDLVLNIVGEMSDRTPAMRLLAATHALSGNREEASLCRMSALDAYPTMTIEGWTNTIAMRDPHHIRHYTEGLSKAGFS